MWAHAAGALLLPLLGPAQRKAPPDGGPLGWLCVASAFATYLICVGTQYAIGIFLSALLLDAAIVNGATRSDVTWAASLESSMFLFGSLPAGVLLPRIGARAVMLLGALLLSLGCLLAASSDSLAGVRTGFLVLGLGCALPASVALTEVQRWFLRFRGTASGLVVAGSGVGGVVLGPLLQSQIDSGGWRQGLRFLATLAAVLLPLCAAATVPIALPSDDGEATALDGRRESEVGGDAALREWQGGTLGEQSLPAEPSGFAVVAAAATAAAAAELPPQKHTLRSLCRVQPFQCLLFYVGLYGGAWFVLINNLNSSFRESGTSADDAALLVSVQGVANTVGRLLMGVAADVLARRGVSKLMLLQTSVGICGVATALLAFPPLLASLPYQGVYYFINGFFGGSIVSLQPGILVDFVGISNLPPAFGLLHAVQAPLVLMLPPAFGALRTAAGWPLVWGLVGAQIGAAIACVSFVREPVKGGGALTVRKLCECVCGSMMGAK